MTEDEQVSSNIQMFKEDWRPVAFEVDTTEIMPIITQLEMECEYGIIGSVDATRAGKRQVTF